jgi:uncharacterized membrane protein
MRKNVGDLERVLRLAGGFGLLGAGWLAGSMNRYARIGMLGLGAELIYTAATRRCPLNAALGRSSLHVPLLAEPLASEVDRRYPEMQAEGGAERVAQEAMGHS